MNGRAIEGCHSDVRNSFHKGKCLSEILQALKFLKLFIPCSFKRSNKYGSEQKMSKEINCSFALQQLGLVRPSLGSETPGSQG